MAEEGVDTDAMESQDVAGSLGSLGDLTPPSVIGVAEPPPPPGGEEVTDPVAEGRRVISSFLQSCTCYDMIKVRKCLSFVKFLY